MIGFLRVVVVGLPATFWYSWLILWASLRRSADLPCRCQEIPRKWARLLLELAGIRVEVEHPERLVAERPQILVANHTSYFDVMIVIGTLPGKFLFVGKKELTRIPVFGPAWLACGHIAIDRQDKAKAMHSLAIARKRLEEDRPTVILFPEGTRSRTGELRAFKKGAFVLAIQTGVEVVPAAILGARDVMRKGSWSIHRGRTVRLRFGAPISVEGLGMQDRDDLTRRAHDAVAALQAGPEQTSREDIS